MKGLMELLAAGDASESKSKTASETNEDSPEVDPSEDSIASSGFSESASQAMDALKAGDSEAFSDALKACIEMVR